MQSPLMILAIVVLVVGPFAIDNVALAGPTGLAWNPQEPSIETDKARLTPRQQYQATIDRYRDDCREFLTSYRSASKEEQSQLEDSFPLAQDYAVDLLDIAEDDPEDESALDSLLWIANRLRSGDTLDRAHEILFDKHFEEQRLGEICRNLAYGIPSQLVEDRLNRLINDSPHDAVQAAAIFAMAGYLRRLDEQRRILVVDGESTPMSEATRQYINTRPPAKTEVLALYQKLKSDYSEHRPTKRSKANYRALAKRAMFEMDHLIVGKTVPEIDGVDLKGLKFKLSDYRGKIVMLDFWGHWSGRSRASMLSRQKIVERFADQPFVLIGVNSDSNLDQIREIVKQESITWRSFWNGKNGVRGGISSSWNVSSWPTVYLIDAQGTIRHKGLAEDRIDEVIEEMLKQRAATEESEVSN